jgi:hypothetical protein
MRLVSGFFAFLVVASFALPSASAFAAPTSAIRLNEIMAGPARDWDGSGTFSSRDDEWVEIVNAGVGDAVLDGFLITDGDSLPRYALSGVLPGGGHLMVTGKQSHDWEVATSNPAFGLSLANTGDAVLLWQVVGADTLLVDGYTYKSHEAAADRAIGRWPDASGEWVIFDSLDPYTGTTPPQGNGCPPSPGAINVCNATPTRPETWGRVKLLYR